jgi:heme exporter protein D
VALITSNFFISGQYAKYLWLALALGPVLLALARRADVRSRTERFAAY